MEADRKLVEIMRKCYEDIFYNLASSGYMGFLLLSSSSRDDGNYEPISFFLRAPDGTKDRLLWAEEPFVLFCRDIHVL